MLFTRSTLAATLAAVLGVATADLQVISPGGPNLWWVAQSTNTLLWNCQESSYQNFTILLANSSPSILSAPIAIIAVEENYQCSQTVTQQQAAQPAATGYTIQFANPLNATDIYAQSQPFEIKALGAAYPAASATPTNSGSASGSATSGGASPSSSSKSGAASLAVPLGLGIAAAAAMAGFMA